MTLRDTSIGPVAPAQLERVVQNLFGERPGKRWQSAKEVKHALDWLKTEAAPVSPATERIAATPSRQRSWLWPAISAALLLVLIGGG
jgi:hypothetical protein